MRQETLKEQLAHARSKGEETVGRNIQVTDCIMTVCVVCLCVCGRGMLSGAWLTPSSCLSTTTCLWYPIALVFRSELHFTCALPPLYVTYFWSDGQMRSEWNLTIVLILEISQEFFLLFLISFLKRFSTFLFSLAIL